MDLTLVRKLAGLTEAHHDDDDDNGEMSASEKDLVAKADKDLKKAGVDVDKDVKKAEKKEAKKPAPKADEDEKKADDKADDKKSVAKHEPKDETKEEKPAEDKPASKKMHQALAWLNANKTATRKEFMTKAADWGMSSKFANVAFYKLKKRLTEAWVLQHPAIDRFVLAENKQFNRFQWVSLEDRDGIDPIVVGTQKEADKISEFLYDHKGQTSIVKKVEDE